MIINNYVQKRISLSQAIGNWTQEQKCTLDEVIKFLEFEMQAHIAAKNEIGRGDVTVYLTLDNGQSK